MDQRVDYSGQEQSGEDSAGKARATHLPHNRRLTAVAALLLAVVAAGIFYWWQSQGEALPSEAADQAPPPPTVTVASPAIQEIIEWDDYPGQFTAVNLVEIRPQVSGYLQSVHFTEGQLVKKGDLLYVIDKRPFEIALETAKAHLAEAVAQSRFAELQLKRAEKLRVSDVVSQATYDDRLEVLTSANAAVSAANAEIHQAELDLDYSEIRSPIDGRIGERQVDIGNLIQGGTSDTTLMATVVSLDPIQFEFNISESNYLAYQRAEAKGLLASMRNMGVQSYVRLADETEWTQNGIIDFVDNEDDMTSGTIAARGSFPNPEGLFTPGQFGRIRVPGSEPYTAILVPESAVLTDQSQKIILAVDEQNKVLVRIVRLGPAYDGLRIVREGLKFSDRIIINGLTRVRPGMVVNPEAGEIAAAP